MSKRLFYTDPLISAYMAREFGVKYSNEWSFDYKYADDRLLTSTGYKHHWPNYIDPDSYSIFSPMEGDICINPDDMPALVISDEKFKRGIHDIKENAIPLKAAREFVPSAAEIILRDNKQFFTPMEDA